MPFLAAQLKGMRFGRLVVVDRSATYRRPGKTQAVWECVCDCGKRIAVITYLLTKGSTRSCGCLKAEIISSGTRRTHGKRRARVYSSWSSMMNRCFNEDCDSYPYYGGRGISVCDRWLRFQSFLDDMGEPGPGMSLDRIDVNKGYEPGNCRWATRSQQMRNQKRTVWILAGGRRQSLPDWAEELGIKRRTLAFRVKSGWPADRAIGIVGAVYA